ncbi:Dabb family protein [Gorillibacterium sp. CAU 1737]|uniref:Dabb family protein n=1 Tax=Gorillibacterium sp. CAU 1737 TaxID=3140362 RepID=UPI0032603656
MATNERIIHSVIFRLKHEAGAQAEQQFLEDGKTLLSAIPSVENFCVLRQVSPKNDYAFGFSMEFADEAAYQSYNEHPSHVAFVQERWETEVEAFLEIDYQNL